MKKKISTLRGAAKQHLTKAVLTAKDPATITKVKHAAVAVGLEKLIHYVWTLLF